jgi:hypothetical protein
MKKQLLFCTLFLTLINFNGFSQSLVWNQCNMYNQGSTTNFNYSKTFTGVAQSATDVQLAVVFIACQPFATNAAGIKLNGTTFIQSNAIAGNCSNVNTNNYTISKSVFNQAVIAGAGSITFSSYTRDSCVPGAGCSGYSDPCIQMTATFTACTTQATPTFTQITPKCAGTIIPALPIDSINGINGSWSPAINNTATTTYTFTPAAGQCATTTTMAITITNPNITPTFTQVSPVCAGTTIPALPVDSTNGINGSWSPALNNTTTTTYTYTPAAGQCATNTTMSITVNPAPAAPTGSTNQTFCTGETVGNLVANGTTVVWYNAPNAGSIVPNSTVLTSGTTYYATQTASSCTSLARLAVTATNGACLANESFDKSSLIVYPNPIKNVLNVSNDEVISTVAIYNILGREVFTKAINAKETTIDTKSLSSGNYIVKVTINNIVKTLKIIKE